MKSFFVSSLPLRRFVHTMYWLFTAGFVVFAFGLLDLSFHDETFIAGLFALSAIALAVPGWLFQLPWFSHGSERALGVIEALLAVSMLASWIGSFWLYRSGIGYDDGVHAVTTGMAAVGFYLLLIANGPHWSREPFSRTIAMLVVLLMIAGTVNEFFEYYGDAWFGTRMYGEDGQPEDAWRDAVANAVGGALGLVFVRRYRRELARL